MCMINQTNQVMKKYGNNEEIDLKSLTFKKRQQFSGIRFSPLNPEAYPLAMAREMERRVEGHSRRKPAITKYWSYRHQSRSALNIVWGFNKLIDSWFFFKL